MSNTSNKSTSKSILEPIERISELLFGLIMVLTFTGSISVAQADRAEVRTLLVGALGCNIAWGIIDGIFYLVGFLSEQGRSIRAFQTLRKATAPQDAQRVIAAALPPLVAATLGPGEYETIRQKLLQRPDPPKRPRLGKTELLGAIGVFLWVFITTFPVATPFLVMHDIARAMRVSNAIAIVLLFVTGYAFGRVANYWPWLTGLVMVLLGCGLLAITFALGG